MNHIKRLSNENNYLVENRYFVIFERLKNTEYGCPRVKVRIIDLLNTHTVYVYSFHCDYSGDQKQAEKIVDVLKTELLFQEWSGKK